MAQHAAVDPRLFKIFLGATPGAGTFICGLKSRGASRSTALAEFSVPDCDNPALVTSLQRRALTKDFQMTGEGTFSKENRVILEAQVGVTTTWCIQVPGTLAEGGGYYAGPIILSEWGIEATDEDGALNNTMTWVGAGDVTWTDAAA